ncbi:hypothetical protein DH2020_039737 [Rehmannia glutinosa]|uniref:Aluminum-activated malate transporter n=1 Tax=Rehmannia glutinosa TaxID=99300 RepID=A0ABR0UUW8_REHGL
MEMNNSQNQETKKTVVNFIMSMPGKLKSSVVETMKTTKKIGEDDPRKIVHAMKVGFALTLVSLFYYFRPLYDGFGQAGMWAILTVVVVFEFTVGGTLSKCLNRGFATLLAGALGIGAEYFASLCGEKGEPVILGLMVFFLATASTFTRFFPNVKRRYDYGVLIFILTFSLVAVSGFRVTQILQLAHQRLSTILIGGATCMVISIFVCPVWAGQDLHNLVALNIEKLGAFLEGFGGEILMYPGDENSKGSTKNDEKSFLQSYKKACLIRKPRRNLWQILHGGSRLMASSELQMRIQQPCIKMSTESGKALKELSLAIKKMTCPSSSSSSSSSSSAHTQNYRAATDDLKNILQNSSSKADLQEIMPLLVIASVLIDITSFVDKIALSVHELSQKACFKKPKVTSILHRGIIKPVDHVADVVVEVDGGSPEKKKNNLT